MDNTLIIDCSAGMSIYFISKDKVYSKVDYNQKKHTDELLLSVDELLGRVGIKIGELKNICVCVGPGSFTGIRVAVSICKGLAIGTGAKIFTCSNFDLLGFGETDKSIYFLEAFSDYVYIREFDGEKFFDSCVHLEDAIQKCKHYEKVIVQNEKLQNLLKNVEINSNIGENRIIKVFEDKISNGKFTSINEISPIYLRASQAEIEREKKLKDSVNG